MDTKERSRIKENGLLWLIVMISVAGMLYFGTQKEGYHVDEMYSYGLANSEYLPFMHFGESEYDVKDWMLEYGAGESFGDLFKNLWKDYQILKDHDFQFYNTPIYRDYRVAQENSADTRTTTWVSGQAYRDYLSVSRNNTFNYASVYYNQRGDVHPPFYYLLLHTVCSLFPGVFSKWFALVINIVFLTGTLLLLYRMVKRYLGGRSPALAVVAVYGFSNGFFTSAMYLRMYAVLTFMVVAMCYVHLKLCAEAFVMKKSTVFSLMAVTLFGFMTHYYFVLYALGIAGVIAVWMTVKKKWGSLWKYILTLAGTAAIGICLWPFAIRHVFSGYRGQESLGVLAAGEFYWIKTKLILDQIFGQLFGGRWWIPIACILLLLITAVIYRKKFNQTGKGLLVLLPIMLYVAVVAQIVPFYAERYVMCTYPFWCLLVISAVWMAVRMVEGMATKTAGKAMRKDTGIIEAPKQEILRRGILSGAVVFLFVINNGFIHQPGYLYTGGQELATVPEGSHCVYVLPDGTWNESAEDTLMLSKCEQVAVVYQSMLPTLQNTYQHQPGDCVMVVLSRNLEEQVVLPQVKEILEIQGLQEAFREEAYNTVRIYLQ